ncbi:hypothetical protein [Allorhizocola rhizosphaerae]|uniref:hypothetical protein n=1 Tax=Allorhizocola rhizosphaerae TaxID=1872709 RepID=UPI000E3D40E8|nr:hypothetical protein [Allorhizocola rhizosphaerae]
MVDIVLSVTVFLLTVAVIGLFAMMGELSSRVPAQEEVPQEAAPPQPIEEARLGAAPAQWPAELAQLSNADNAVIVVFSTLCTTCRRIAGGQTGLLTGVSGVLISCPGAGRGTEFLNEFPMLRDHPVALDVEGHWLTTNFGVDISPSVLVFERGRLLSAHTFTSAPSLQLLHTHPNHEKEGISAGQSATA